MKHLSRKIVSLRIPILIIAVPVRDDPHSFAILDNLSVRRGPGLALLDDGFHDEPFIFGAPFALGELQFNVIFPLEKHAPKTLAVNNPVHPVTILAMF